MRKAEIGWVVSKRIGCSVLAVTVACLVCLCSCDGSLGPTPETLAPTLFLPSPTAPPTGTLPPNETPTSMPAPIATPTPTPAVRATTETGIDAFAVSYFPWADRPASWPMYTGEGRAKVVNSIFLADPPFFGFDIHPPEQWYHVVGVSDWAAIDSELISPTINPYRLPRDGDQVLLHGHIEGDFITASYVGFSDGTFYYYRSLLHADELRPGVLPRAFDGLDVWVRGVLDVTAGQGQFYALPAGTAIDRRYVGQEALAAGRLVMGDRIHVEVTRGIFVKESGRFVQVMTGQLLDIEADVVERGIIRGLDWARGWIQIEGEEGRRVEMRMDDRTLIQFSDGSQAESEELAVGQRIEVMAQSVRADKTSVSKVTIQGATASGMMFAAYVGGTNGDLWSVSLDGLQRRQVTELVSPTAGLGDARFSPDGLRLAFARRQGRESTLVIGDLIKGALSEWLTADEWEESDPAWSPDGLRLAFCRYRVNGDQVADGALWVLALRDGSVQRVTAAAPEGWRTVQPRWSPDGRRIAYGQVSEDPSQPVKLFVLSLPSTSQAVFEWGSDWRWSPDSTQLLCTRQTPEESRARLWLLQRDGTSPTWLSDTGTHDQRGRWSPDGTSIAFLSRPLGSTGPDYLWLMESDGMHKSQPEGAPLASDLAWSPDGRTLVFRRVTPAGGDAGIWLVSADGTGLLQLAADVIALAGTYQEP